MNDNKKPRISYSNIIDFVPIKLINVIGIITLILLLWLLYSFYQSDHELIESEQFMVKIEEVQGKILLYNEMLTMSAHMAVVTGDIAWEQRYRNAENKLDEALVKLTVLSPGLVYKQIEKTKKNNQQLIEYENKVFELIKLGNNEQAKAILDNEKYHAYKKEYAMATDALHKILQDFIQQKEITAETEQSYYFFALLAIFTVFLLAWLTLNIILKRESARQQENQKLIQEADVFLKGVLENAVDGIISIDKKGVILSVNPATERLFGYTAEEMLGKNVKILMPSPYHEEHDGYLNNYHGTGKKKIIGIGREVIGKRKDGSTFPMELSVSENKVGDSHSFTGIVRDISERKEAEQSILNAATENEKTNNFLKGILDNAVDGIISIDKKGTILSVNPAAEQLFGYSADEMAGQNVKVLMPSPYHEEHDGYLTNYHGTGKKKIIGIGREVIGRCKDGSTFPMELSVSENKVGDSHSFTGIVRDISEQVQSQRTLEDQKIYYENLFRDLNVAAFILDNDHNVVMWNKACEEMTGAKASDLIGTRNYRKAIYKEDRPLLADLVLKESYEDSSLYPVDIENSIISEGKKVQNWVDFPLKNMSAIYLTIDAGPVYDASGDRVGVMQVMQDITTMKRLEDSILKSNEQLKDFNEELKQAKKSMTSQKEYYESLIYGLGAPVFVINKEHKVITWNKECEKLTGLSAEEVLGTDQHWQGFYHERRKMFADLIIEADFSQREELFVERSFEHEWSDEQDYIETWNQMNNGTRRYIRAYCNPLKDDDNNIVAVAEVLFDLTQLKESHQALEKRQEELQRSNSELERFAYVASHDLQEPLRMVSSYTQLLEKRYKDKLDQDAKDYINYAVDGAVRMQSLIQDLLKYSRLNTDLKEFQDVDTNQLFDHAVQNLAVTIDETGTVVTKDELPIVSGDDAQLRQLFQNLIGNAVKYRDPEKLNTVHISVQQVEGGWQFCVEDNGIGIASEYYEKIFVIFKRLHNATEYKGTGIGLSLCKRIVEAHHGRIWLESELGQGSQFYFTILNAET